MVEAVSQVKLPTTSAPVNEIKKDIVVAKPIASNLERTPEKDSVNVNGKEKTEGKKKSFTGWLIGAGVAIVGTGIYFLTRGKKGSKAVNEAAQEAAQTVKKGVNDTVQKVEDAVATAVKKEEPVEILQQKIPEKTKAKEKNVAKDITNPHTDDYLNINGIADDVLDLNNHGMKEHFSDLVSPLDDYDTPLVENIFDIGGDFLDGVS